jgi:FixJ family two-component response regulator
MTALTMSTVVVVDDDEWTCRALERSLSFHGYRVRTYSCARDYLADRDQVDAACLLADINMPEVDGLNMHQAELKEGYDIPTVFITGRVDVRTAVRAMKEGALDLLEKPLEPSLLIETIDGAIARWRIQRAAREELATVWRSLDLLTPREAEVCALVASGRLNKQIAALIGTTEKTVKVHRARVMHKLGVQSVAELVRLVDRVLATPPGLLFDADHRALRRPRALALMASALGTAGSTPADMVPNENEDGHTVANDAAAAAESYF